MIARHSYWAVGLLLLAAGPASAAVFKCIDAAGKVTYSGKQEATMTCTPVTATVNQVPFIPPQQTEGRQRPSAGSERAPTEREQLKQQIATEEAALEKAKQELAEQETIRLGGERNYQRVLDRLKPYQEKIAEIEKRLDDLKSQLKNSK